MKCAAVLNYCYLYNFHHSITYGYCLRGYFVACCCSDGGCCSDTWQKSSSSVWFLGLLACSIYLGLYHVFSSFLPNSKGWVDLRTELSSAVSCIKVVFYCSVKVRTRKWFWEEHCGHVNTLWFTLSAGHVPSKPQFGFYWLIFLSCIQHSMFPGVCLPIHVLSYFSLLPKPNLLSGCGYDVLFPRSAFSI